MIDDISARHPSKYLSHDDLRGRTLTLKIETSEQEEVKLAGGKDFKTVLRFEGVDKPLVNNTTNDYAIAVLLSRKPSEWIGKRVVVGPGETTFGARTIPCVRVLGSPDATPARAKAFDACLKAVEGVDAKSRTTMFAQELKYTLSTIDPVTAPVAPKKESNK